MHVLPLYLFSLIFTLLYPLYKKWTLEKWVEQINIFMNKALLKNAPLRAHFITMCVGVLVCVWTRGALYLYPPGLMLNYYSIQVFVSHRMQSKWMVVQNSNQELKTICFTMLKHYTHLKTPECCPARKPFKGYRLVWNSAQHTCLHSSEHSKTKLPFLSVVLLETWA